MAQVRMRVGLAGINFAHCAGEVYECDEASAARLIAVGFAEPLVTPEPTPPPQHEAVIETAMRAAPPEKAVKPRGRGRG